MARPSWKVVTILERLPHPRGEETLRSTPSFSRHLWVQPGMSCLGIFKDLGLHEDRHYVHQGRPLPHCILAENGFREPLASIFIASCHVSQEGPQDWPKAKQRKPKCICLCTQHSQKLVLKTGCTHLLVLPILCPRAQHLFSSPPSLQPPFLDQLLRFQSTHS